MILGGGGGIGTGQLAQMALNIGVNVTGEKEILGLGVTVRDTVDKITETIDGAKRGIEGFQQSINNMRDKTVGSLEQMAKSATYFYAETQKTGTALRVMARNLGYNAESINKTVEAVKDLGVTTRDAQQNVRSLLQAKLSPELSKQIAEASRNIGVFANGTSDAMWRITHAMQTTETEVLETIGLSENASQIFAKYARQVGKSAQALTEFERKQAIANFAIQKGTEMSGAYEESMQDAGKILSSMTRLQDEYQNIVGQRLVPVLKTQLELQKGLYEWFENLNPVIQTTVVMTGALGAGIGKLVPQLAMLGGIGTSILSQFLPMGLIANFMMFRGLIADLLVKFGPDMKKYVTMGALALERMLGGTNALTKGMHALAGGLGTGKLAFRAFGKEVDVLRDGLTDVAALGFKAVGRLALLKVAGTNWTTGAGVAKGVAEGGGFGLLQALAMRVAGSTKYGRDTGGLTYGRARALTHSKNTELMEQILAGTMAELGENLKALGKAVMNPRKALADLAKWLSGSLMGSLATVGIAVAAVGFAFWRINDAMKEREKVLKQEATFQKRREGMAYAYEKYQASLKVADEAGLNEQQRAAIHRRYEADLEIAGGSTVNQYGKSLQKIQATQEALQRATAPEEAYKQQLQKQMEMYRSSAEQNEQLRRRLGPTGRLPGSAQEAAGLGFGKKTAEGEAAVGTFEEIWRLRKLEHQVSREIAGVQGQIAQKSESYKKNLEAARKELAESKNLLDYIGYRQAVQNRRVKDQITGLLLGDPTYSSRKAQMPQLIAGRPDAPYSTIEKVAGPGKPGQRLGGLVTGPGEQVVTRTVAEENKRRYAADKSLEKDYQENMQDAIRERKKLMDKQYDIMLKWAPGPTEEQQKMNVDVDNKSYADRIKEWEMASQNYAQAVQDSADDLREVQDRIIRQVQEAEARLSQSRQGMYSTADRDLALGRIGQKEYGRRRRNALNATGGMGITDSPEYNQNVVEMHNQGKRERAEALENIEFQRRNTMGIGALGTAQQLTAYRKHVAAIGHLDKETYRQKLELLKSIDQELNAFYERERNRAEALYERLKRSKEIIIEQAMAKNQRVLSQPVIGTKAEAAAGYTRQGEALKDNERQQQKLLVAAEQDLKRLQERYAKRMRDFQGQPWKEEQRQQEEEQFLSQIQEKENAIFNLRMSHENAVYQTKVHNHQEVMRLLSEEWDNVQYGYRKYKEVLLAYIQSVLKANDEGKLNMTREERRGWEQQEKETVRAIIEERVGAMTQLRDALKQLRGDSERDEMEAIEKQRQEYARLTKDEVAARTWAEEAKKQVREKYAKEGQESLTLGMGAFGQLNIAEQFGIVDTKSKVLEDFQKTKRAGALDPLIKRLDQQIQSADVMEVETKIVNLRGMKVEGFVQTAPGRFAPERSDEAMRGYTSQPSPALDGLRKGATKIDWGDYAPSVNPNFQSNLKVQVVGQLLDRHGSPLADLRVAEVNSMAQTFGDIHGAA